MDSTKEKGSLLQKKKRRLPVKRLYKHIYIQKNEWVKKKKWKDKSQQNKQTNKV